MHYKVNARHNAIPWGWTKLGNFQVQVLPTLTPRVSFHAGRYGFVLTPVFAVSTIHFLAHN